MKICLSSNHTTLQLHKGSISTWYCETNQIEKKFYSKMKDSLSEAELSEYKNYANAEAAEQFLIGKFLVRNILSLYFPDVEPGLWEFEKNQHGKPFLSNPRFRQKVYFNLSHTKGMVAVALASDELGLDVEKKSYELDVDKISKDVLNDEELSLLSSAQGQEKIDLFYKFWTLKEAYIKATGLGLKISLPSLRFIKQDQEYLIKESSSHWRLSQFQPSRHFIMAVAVSDIPGVKFTFYWHPISIGE